MSDRYDEIQYMVEGQAAAKLRIPDGTPQSVVDWAKGRIERDVRDGDRPPHGYVLALARETAKVSYLAQAHALGRTTAEAVDEVVRRYRFQWPAADYRAALQAVLDADAELKEAYRATPA